MNEPTDDLKTQNSKCEELRNRTAERERSRIDCGSWILDFENASCFPSLVAASLLRVSERTPNDTLEFETKCWKMSSKIMITEFNCTF